MKINYTDLRISIKTPLQLLDNALVKLHNVHSEHGLMKAPLEQIVEEVEALDLKTRQCKSIRSHIIKELNKHIDE